MPQTRSMAPTFPRMYAGVRRWPGGWAALTRTRSPTPKRRPSAAVYALGVIALAHLGHLALQLGLGEKPFLEEQVAQRLGGALEIGELVIAAAELFGRAPQLVEAHHLTPDQRAAQRVCLLLPELHPVID